MFFSGIFRQYSGSESLARVTPLFHVAFKVFLTLLTDDVGPQQLNCIMRCTKTLA